MQACSPLHSVQTGLHGWCASQRGHSPPQPGTGAVRSQHVSTGRQRDGAGLPYRHVCMLAAASSASSCNAKMACLVEPYPCIYHPLGVHPYRHDAIQVAHSARHGQARTGPQCSALSALPPSLSLSLSVLRGRTGSADAAARPPQSQQRCEGDWLLVSTALVMHSQRRVRHGGHANSLPYVTRIIFTLPYESLHSPAWQAEQAPSGCPT